MTPETIVTGLILLSFVEAQIALVLASVAFLRSKTPAAPPVWEMTEEEKDAAEAIRLKEEARLESMKSASYNELRQVFDAAGGFSA